MLIRKNIKGHLIFNMIREKIVDDYMNFVIMNNNDNSPLLKELYKKAVNDKVPVIKPEMEGFLKTLLSICKPKKILELGTAVGYSGSIFLFSNKECELVTVEKNTKYAEIASENFSNFNFDGRYKIHNKDILECKEIKNYKYDFIFVDAAKGSYDEYFEIVKELILDNGLIIFDNVLQNGEIAKSKYAVNRRGRTIHKRMKNFINKVLSDDEFVSSLLTISDGVLMCKKKESI